MCQKELFEHGVPDRPHVPLIETCARCGEPADRPELCKTCYTLHFVDCEECGEPVESENGFYSDTFNDGIYHDECYAKTFAECPGCSKDIRLSGDHMTNTAGEVYHVDCYYDEYTSCAACDVEVESIDAVGYGDSLYCPRCFDRRFSDCVDCEETFPNNDFCTIGDNRYCGVCVHEHFSMCDNCGEWSRNDEVYGEDDNLCESCFEDSDECSKPGRSLLTIPTFERLTSQRRFGVELETSECKGYRDVRKAHYFADKDDGSIDGREFVSPPMCGDNGLAAIEEFCALAEQKGWKVDEKCGFHLHFDVSELSHEQLCAVAVAFNATRRVWQSFVPAKRRENGYCGNNSWGIDDIRNLDHEDETSFRYWTSCRDRYQWFNVASYGKHRTFEMRLHTGTLEAHKVINWLRAVLALADYAATLSLEEAYEEFGNRSTQDAFEALSRIWGPQVTEYLGKRAAKFGTHYTLTVEA